MLFSRLSSAAVLLAVAVGPLSAQVRPGSPPLPPSSAAPTVAMHLGTIDGVVADSNLVPVQAAFVSILGTKIRVGTGPNGRFRITKIPAGKYLVLVKRVGYHPTS